VVELEVKFAPRTLVRLGQNSLVISMPKEWITKNNLNKGDIVYLRQDSNDLILSTEGKPIFNTREITITTDKKNIKYIKTEIITAYLSGYDIIRIRGERIVKDSQKLKAMIRDLIGLEIAEESREKIIAKEILDIEKTSLDSTFRRTDFLVRGMFEDLLVAKNKEDYRNIYERDADVNRQTYLIYRIVRKTAEYPSLMYSLGLDFNKAMILRRIAFSVEQIGDHIKRLAKVCYFRDISVADEKEVRSLVLLFRDTYLQTLEAYYKVDKATAIKVEIDNENKIHKCRKFLRDNPKYFNAEISYLLQNISRSLRRLARAICEIS